jgi:ABC-type transport system involved in multi-copper enzyme maturation permease subunit
MTIVGAVRGERARPWLLRLAGAVAGGGLAVAALVSTPLAIAAALAVALLAAVAMRRQIIPWLRTTTSGAIAVGLKELRGRMRGRRAFTILTIYLALLAGFAWAVIQIQERGAQSQINYLPGRDVFPGGGIPGIGQAALGAQIGQTLFVALLVVLTIVVVLLAPAFTASAISGERERQTFEMLAATPLNGTAVVVGKLFSALGYLFLLVLASIPLMSLVFTFGGVSVDDIVRAYVVLVASAISFGAVGLFLSALVRRTGTATILSYVAVLAVTLASLFVFVFWGAMVDYKPGATVGRDPIGALGKRPPEALVLLDPALAVADLACSTSSGELAYYSCALTTYVTNTPYFGQPQTYLNGDLAPILDGVGFDDGTRREAAIAPVINPFGVPRDLIWPRIVASQLVFAFILTIGSILLVGPTRPSLRLGGRRAVGVPASAPDRPVPSEVAS